TDVDLHLRWVRSRKWDRDPSRSRLDWHRLAVNQHAIDDDIAGIESDAVGGSGIDRQSRAAAQRSAAQPHVELDPVGSDMHRVVCGRHTGTGPQAEDGGESDDPSHSPHEWTRPRWPVKTLIAGETADLYTS